MPLPPHQCQQQDNETIGSSKNYPEKSARGWEENGAKGAKVSSSQVVIRRKKKHRRCCIGKSNNRAESGQTKLIPQKPSPKERGLKRLFLRQRKQKLLNISGEPATRTHLHSFENGEDGWVTTDPERRKMGRRGGGKGSAGRAAAKEIAGTRGSPERATMKLWTASQETAPRAVPRSTKPGTQFGMRQPQSADTLSPGGEHPPREGGG